MDARTDSKKQGQLPRRKPIRRREGRGRGGSQIQQTRESRQRLGEKGIKESTGTHSMNRRRRKKAASTRCLGERVEIRNTKIIASKLSRRDGPGNRHSRTSR